MLTSEKNRLGKIYQTYQTLTKKLTDEKVIANLDLYAQLKRELKKITPLAHLYQEWLVKQEELNQWQNLLKDETFSQENSHALLQEINKDLLLLEKTLLALEDKIFTPPPSSTNIIIEIRGAVGGQEANLFAKDLFQMYLNFLKKKKWDYEIWEKISTSDGGYNFVSFLIKNFQAASLLNWEGGVHRVQRIPKTESSGRIHTSTVTVAVLPEKTEAEVPLASKDLRFDTFRSSGAGGQHVNTTDSAVRVTHLPTGLAVSCQQGRSQHDNKDKALKLLRARLFKLHHSQWQATKVSVRNQQIGEGERSEKIRTYNFPQNRVTDHRINLTIKNIEHIMAGRIEKLLKKLAVLKEKE